MTQGRKFRTAIVGCGRISNIHISAVKELGNAEIVAVCDLDEKMAMERASQHGITQVYTDLESMLREARPDIVHILTPPASHLALTKIAAKYGVNIYIEKPMAANRADAQAIVETVQDAGVSLCPGHSRIFEPIFLDALRRIREGEIGRVISARAEVGFTYEGIARAATIPWSYTYDWGIFDNLMPHVLYTVSRFLEEPGQPQVVGLNLGAVRESAVEEFRVLIPAKNAIGEVSLSLCSSPEVNRLEIVGARGRIFIDFITLTQLATAQSGMPSIVTRLTSNFGTALKLTSSGLGMFFGIATGKIKRFMGIRSLVARFYLSLEHGSKPPVGPEDGLINATQLEQIKIACQQIAKQRIPVEQADMAEGKGPRILVTGASGFLGGHLVRRLSADGVPVRATTRLMSRAKQLPGVQWVQCDLASEDDLGRALIGVETVFHCAAMVGPPGSLEDYQEANVRGTVRLAKMAARAGVKNLIYVSSISVYGSPKKAGRYLDESAPYEERASDRGVYTITKLEAEKALLDFVNHPNGYKAPRTIVLRPGSIFGPGAKIPLGRFPLPSTNRRPIITGSRKAPMPLTYIDNMIDALLAAANSTAPSGSVYNVVDSADLDQGEVSRILRKLSNGKIRPIFLPYPFVWAMMFGIDLISLVRNRQLGTARFRLKRTLADMRFKCNAAKDELGWQPRVPFSEGLSRVFETTMKSDNR